MLTTNKFIKEVKAMGLAAIAVDEFFRVENSDGYIVAFVDTKLMYTFNTVYDNFQELSESDRKRLFNLLVEYANTPPDKREEPQKFYMQFTTVINNGAAIYLNYNTINDSLGLSTRGQTLRYQAQFTQKEIDDIKEKFGVTLSDFVQIPIEEVED